MARRAIQTKGFLMFAGIREKLKGWKTIIFARSLVIIGTIVGGVIPLLQMVTSEQISSILPDKLIPWSPLIIAAIGLMAEWLRRTTTGPVGSKGEEPATPETKAGD